MWKLLTVRRSYYQTDEYLVWVRSPQDILDLLPLLHAEAATCHTFKED